MSEPLRATREKVSESMGTGCLVQAIGVPCLFFFPIGTVIGVILLVIGSRMSTRYVCGACRTKLPDSKGRICPACKAEFRTSRDPEP